jgi:hypothetical protein
MMVASMPSDAHVATGGLGGFVAHGLAARLTTICAGLAFGIAFLVLGAHLIAPGHGPLGGPAMKPNTALCLLFLSVCQYLLLRSKGRPEPQGRVLVSGALALSIACATLSEYALELDLGIDGLLVSLQHPRMSAITAIALTALASVTVLMALRAQQTVLCQTLLVVTTLCSLLPIVGYLYRAPFLYGGVAAVAPGTAVAGLCLTVGFMALRSDEGIWPLLIGDSAGSTLLRRALPAVLILPA